MGIHYAGQSNPMDCIYVPGEFWEYIWKRPTAKHSAITSSLQHCILRNSFCGINIHFGESKQTSLTRCLAMRDRLTQILKLNVRPRGTANVRSTPGRNAFSKSRREPQSERLRKSIHFYLCQRGIRNRSAAAEQPAVAVLLYIN